MCWGCLQVGHSRLAQGAVLTLPHSTTCLLIVGQIDVCVFLAHTARVLAHIWRVRERRLSDSFANSPQNLPTFSDLRCSLCRSAGARSIVSHWLKRAGKTRLHSGRARQARSAKPGSKSQKSVHSLIDDIKRVWNWLLEFYQSKRPVLVNSCLHSNSQKSVV